MMGNENFGESSQDNDDSDRPLKKAKYVWQVKGKYHLKTKPEPKLEQPKCSCNCGKQIIDERKCLETFLAKTETFFDSDDDDTISKNIDKSISNEIPITLVSPNLKNEDYYLRKWQARQIARGYIDNTINRVLEDMNSAPFDAEDFVENCEDDGRVENQGILMAIEAHGLQSKKDELAFLRLDELADSALDKIDTALKKGLDTPEVEYPVSVLDAAILVAIERKGLSSNK